MADVQPGLTAELSEEVTDANSTRHLSGVQVFTTPHLVALLEHTCMKAIAPYFAEGESSVGAGINMKHLAGTPKGMTVRATCRLIEVKKGRMLTFTVEAYDDQDKVAEGTHWRAIVRTDEVAAKMRRKAGLEA
ncbi:MAG: thioesterase family protein [Chloroflexota bacterium]